jgi:hypothetical protein
MRNPKFLSQLCMRYNFVAHNILSRRVRHTVLSIVVPERIVCTKLSICLLAVFTAPRAPWQPHVPTPTFYALQLCRVQCPQPAGASHVSGRLFCDKTDCVHARFNLPPPHAQSRLSSLETPCSYLNFSRATTLPRAASSAGEFVTRYWSFFLCPIGLCAHSLQFASSS